MPNVYKIPEKTDDLYVLYDTFGNEAYNEIKDTYKVSDMKKMLNMSYMAIGVTISEKASHVSYIIKSGLNHIMIDEPRSKNDIYMIVSGTYIQWINLISMNNSLYKNIENYLIKKTGLSDDQLLSMIIEPRSIHQNIIYNSSFDPNIDEIIEDIVEDDGGR